MNLGDVIDSFLEGEELAIEQDTFPLAVLRLCLRRDRGDGNLRDVDDRRKYADKRQLGGRRYQPQDELVRAQRLEVAVRVAVVLGVRAEEERWVNWCSGRKSSVNRS